MSAVVAEWIDASTVATSPLANALYIPFRNSTLSVASAMDPPSVVGATRPPGTSVEECCYSCASPWPWRPLHRSADQ